MGKSNRDEWSIQASRFAVFPCWDPDSGLALSIPTVGESFSSLDMTKAGMGGGHNWDL